MHRPVGRALSTLAWLISIVAVEVFAAEPKRDNSPDVSLTTVADSAERRRLHRPSTDPVRP